MKNIFPSTIFIAKNNQKINDKIGDMCLELKHEFNKNNPDILYIDKDSGWGIDQIRKINNFLSQKPFSHSSKIVIISEAQNLNIESQNALLKNLEEPGESNYFIISSNKIKNILPTVISRCQIINMFETDKKSFNKNIEITGNLSKDLSLSEKLGKNKEDILPLLENELNFLQQDLIKNPNKKTSYLIDKIIKAIQMINSNVDPKNALDYVFLA